MPVINWNVGSIAFGAGAFALGDGMGHFPMLEPKDPNATKDYVVDWTDYLQGDTLATSVFTVPVGLTKDSETNSSTSAIVWLSGGTVGTIYTILNRITTTAGRTDDRSFRIEVKER